MIRTKHKIWWVRFETLITILLRLKHNHIQKNHETLSTKLLIFYLNKQNIWLNIINFSVPTVLKYISALSRPPLSLNLSSRNGDLLTSGLYSKRSWSPVRKSCSGYSCMFSHMFSTYSTGSVCKEVKLFHAKNSPSLSLICHKVQVLFLFFKTISQKSRILNRYNQK